MREATVEEAFRIDEGLADGAVMDAARLFWEARRRQLGAYIPDGPRGLAFLAATTDPALALAATDSEGRLLGFAGLSARGRRFWRPTTRHAFATLGPLRGLPFALAFLLRTNSLRLYASDGVLLLDGVYVDAAARQHGVGEALLDAVIALARREEFDQVRTYLDEPSGPIRPIYEERGFRMTDMRDHFRDAPSLTLNMRARMDLHLTGAAA